MQVHDWRVVTVTVHNVMGGGNASALAELTLRIGAAGAMGNMPTTRTLAILSVPELAAGHSATFRIPWDATADFGDVELVATVNAPGDVDLENNVARKATFVRVGGLNAGVVFGATPEA